MPPCVHAAHRRLRELVLKSVRQKYVSSKLYSVIMFEYGKSLNIFVEDAQAD